MRTVAGLLALATAAAPAAATGIQVEITGIVEYNQINSGPLAAVSSGDQATIVLLLDSTSFVDSASFPTRGYVIDEESFSFTLGATVVGLQDPFPGAQTPYFAIRDNDPAVDGFFVATSTDFPIGVPLDEPGAFGQFACNVSVTYTGDTLPSLDILDAIGVYDFTGLTVFNFTVDDGPFQPIGIVFERMTIAALADCSADVDRNGAVDVDDLVAVILDWGCVEEVLPCIGDVTGNGFVDVDDLVEVILQWGPCR